MNVHKYDKYVKINKPGNSAESQLGLYCNLVLILPEAAEDTKNV